MLKLSLYLLFILAFMASCHQPEITNVPVDGLWKVDDVNAPTTLPSGEGNLFMKEDGTLYLSWIASLNGNAALQYASFDGQKWSEATTIAQGQKWFVNWADIPSLAVREDGGMAAHWLEKSEAGTYDYDIRVSQSADGKSWAAPFTLHQDGVPAEHGFVSMEVMPNQDVMAIWLDGRLTKQEGPMTLRSVVFDEEGNRIPNTTAEIDDYVCDCCQTDLAMTENGAVAVYRNRTEKEVRDIYISCFQDGEWSKGVPVADERWVIHGCPVNGPAVSTLGEQVAVAWFSAPNNKKGIKLAISSDEGKSFQQPILLDSGSLLGRVDVVWASENTLAVSWMALEDKQAVLKLATVSTSGQIMGTQTLVKMKPSRTSGFPILARNSHGLYLAYRQMEPSPQVKVLMLKSEGS